MNVVEFQPDHLPLLLAQGGEAYAGSRELLAQPGYGDILKASGPAWTGFDGGVIVGCGGFHVEHPQLSTAWTLLNPLTSGRRMVLVDRVTRRMLAACPARRIQAYTDPCFTAGSRWLELLGFQPEGLLRCFTPAGNDMRVYARVQHG